MPYIEGYLIEGGIDNSLPRPPARPGNALPGDQPSIDNSLPGRTRPVDPGYGIPLPPVTVWPTPPTIGYPLPIPPTYPVPPPVIDNSPPSPPTMWPTPPIPPTTWPPPQPIRPGVPIYPTYPAPPYPPHVGGGPVPEPPPHVGGGPMPGGERPDNALPMPPGSIWPPVPGLDGPVVALVWLVGYGYRWTSIDPSLEVGYQLPTPPGGRVDNTLPPVAEPRRG
jgi:hypothetical protein